MPYPLGHRGCWRSLRFARVHIWWTSCSDGEREFKEKKEIRTCYVDIGSSLHKKGRDSEFFFSRYSEYVDGSRDTQKRTAANGAANKSTNRSRDLSKSWGEPPSNSRLWLVDSLPARVVPRAVQTDSSCFSTRRPPPFYFRLSRCC